MSEIQELKLILKDPDSSIESEKKDLLNMVFKTYLQRNWIQRKKN